MPFVAPWLKPADPVEEFLRGAQLASQIKAENQRLALESQRMQQESIARQQELQKSMAMSQAQIAQARAYHEAQIGLQQARLAQAGAVADAKVKEAAQAAAQRFALGQQNVGLKGQQIAGNLELGQQRLGLGEQREGETERHNLTEEGIATKRADAAGTPTSNVMLPGGSTITGKVTNPLIRGALGTNAPPGMPPVQGALPQAATPPVQGAATSVPAKNTVTRLLKNGRQGIFDANTKQFLGYADQQ
jgi:hypothetical protein